MAKIPYVVTGDIHVGAIPSKQLESELSILLEACDKIENGLIVISGDLFDYRMSASSENYQLAILLISQIMTLAQHRNNKVRIIKGTLSHDGDQLEALDIIGELIKGDIKIITKVTTEEIYPGMRVLYLPEEYPDNPEYYDEYLLDNKYDMVFGHGMVDKAEFQSTIQETEFTHPNSYTFDTATLSDITYGKIYFGHIHKRLTWGKMSYTNSYSRFGFGEEDDKGFYTGVYDTENKKVENEEFIVNTKARKYTTLYLDDKNSVFQNNEPTEIMYHIMQMVDSLLTECDFLRIKVDIPEKIDGSFMSALLRETYSSHRRVTLDITSVRKAKIAAGVKDTVNMLLEEWKDILVGNLDYAEKLRLYIKKQFGIDLSKSDIDKVVKKHLDKILTKK